jgi:hypothetical protein
MKNLGVIKEQSKVAQTPFGGPGFVADTRSFVWNG